MKEKKKTKKSVKPPKGKKSFDESGTATPPIGKTPDFLPPS